MGYLRLVLRILFFAVWTLVLVLVWINGHLALKLVRRSVHPWRGWIVRRWARGLCWVLGMRLQVHGTPPRAPFMLVANHLSYVDVLLLHSRLRAVFVSKAEVDDWPVIGWLARTFGTLFINRTVRRDVLRVDALIREVLERGDGVVFFPEGTTSRGDRVYRFKASLLDLAAREERPVHFAALHYATSPGAPPADKVVCWWGGVSFGAHLLRLLRLPGFRATVAFGDEPVQAGDRKELAERLQQGVAQHFTPVVSDHHHADLDPSR